MNITRDNYEIFFLDYLEGHLEESLIDPFLDFLEQNPDLKEELQLFENVHLPQESIAFPGKKQLYRLSPEEREAFDLKAVALMEGDLKKAERRLLEAYLEKHPELKKEAALFEKTRLIADKSILFPDKEKLYRRTKTVLWVTWLARVAAVVLLFWGIHALYLNEINQPSQVGRKEVASVARQKTDKGNPEDGRVNQGMKARAEKKENEDRRQETEVGKPDGGTKTKGNGKKRQETVEREFLTSHSSPEGHQPEEKQTGEAMVMEKMDPIIARLETATTKENLAVSRAVTSEKPYDNDNVLTVDQYLAKRAKRATNEGLLSAHRLIRAGLNVASELSGERIGYTVKEGKVASLDFDSRLLAFSIPLEKK